MRSLAKLTAALAVAFLGFAGAASANPWNNESGHGKWRGGGDERGWDGDRGRPGGWDRGRRHDGYGRHAYDLDRHGGFDCRTIIVRRENHWGQMVTRRIQRCG